MTKEFEFENGMFSVSGGVMRIVRDNWAYSIDAPNEERTRYGFTSKEDAYSALRRAVLELSPVCVPADAATHTFPDGETAVWQADGVVYGVAIVYSASNMAYDCCIYNTVTEAVQGVNESLHHMRGFVPCLCFTYGTSFL